MNINRDNYENYFLLYLDKELSGEEMREVESFITGHPDLEQEFKKLQEVILEPGEEITFDHKPQILRFNGSGIEEKMLLLLDNELEESIAAELLTEIESSAVLSAEWATLKNTRLDTDEKVVFENKSILYRKEKTRVITGRFMKWAVAAALIGTGFFFGVRLLRLTDKPAEGLGSVVSTFPKAVGMKPVPTNQSTVVMDSNPNKNNPGVNTAVQVNHNNANGNINRAESTGMAAMKTPNKTDRSVKKPGVLPEVLPADDKKILANHNTYKALEKDNELLAQTSIIVKPEQHTDLTDVNIMDLPKNSLAATTALTTEKNDNHILFMSEDAVAHTRAAGLFRRIKRTVERKTKINTGNSLKIAGFEIAIN